MRSRRAARSPRCNCVMSVSCSRRTRALSAVRSTRREMGTNLPSASPGSRGYDPGRLAMCASAAARPAMTSAIEPIASTTRRTRTRDRASRWIARREMPRRGVQRVLSESVMRGVAIITADETRDATALGVQIRRRARGRPARWRRTRSSRRASPCSSGRIRRNPSLARRARRRRPRRWRGARPESPSRVPGGNNCASAPTTTTPAPGSPPPPLPFPLPTQGQG